MRGAPGLIEPWLMRKATTHRQPARLQMKRVILRSVLAGIAAAHPAFLPASRAVAAEIAVTVAGPATGRQASRTQAMLAGARQAADAINAASGIKGERVRVDFAEDGCDAATAKAQAEALTRKKVDLVLGHPCGSAGAAAAAVYSEMGTMFISTASRQPWAKRPQKAATVFRLSGRDDQQGVEAAQFLASRFKGRAIAIVHDRTRAQRAIAEAAAGTLIRLGAGPPIIATLIGGDKDFPLLTAKIKSADAIFFAGYPLEAGMLYSQLRKAGSSPAFLMSESNGTIEFTDTFGSHVGGTFVMRPRFALTEDDSSRDAETRILLADETLASAAVAAFAAAANAADSVNPEVIARELAARGYITPHGIVRFDVTGAAERPSYDVYSWTGKNWERANSGPLDR